MSNPFYASTRWRKVRAKVLRRNPLCHPCLERGITEPATEVDHVVPMSKGGAHYDMSNLMPICKPCHANKTAWEVKMANRKSDWIIVDEAGRLVSGRE